MLIIRRNGAGWERGRGIEEEAVGWEWWEGGGDEGEEVKLGCRAIKLRKRKLLYRRWSSFGGTGNRTPLPEVSLE